MAGQDERRITKVTKFRILKPVPPLTWEELGKLLRDVRYRVFRLANLIVSEAYLNFHMFRTGQSEDFKTAKPGELSKRLRQMLLEEMEKKKIKDASEQLNRFSKINALPDTVAGALSQYKIRAVTNANKWRQVIRGDASLPTFRRDMAIPIRCDKPYQRRLEKHQPGDVEVELMICAKPYPRVVLATRRDKIGDGQFAVLQKLLENKDQSTDGYRQRYFEIKQEKFTGKWHLFVTYDFPALHRQKPDPKTIVGVDVGVSVPLYVALNKGHARLGWRHFAGVGHRIRSLRNQLDARRRNMQRAGRADLSSETAGAGHGRKRKLQPIEKLQGRIQKSYSTLNHQLSKSVVEFALNHGAGAIQMEDLEGLKDVLRGTFIGARWRYHQLQQFIEYKAKEVGIVVRKVNPAHTSRRCSKCGFINSDFDRAYRDAHRTEKGSAKFLCPECEYEADADYNAARNIATLEIAKKIAVQCKRQGIALPEGKAL